MTTENTKNTKNTKTDAPVIENTWKAIVQQANKGLEWERPDNARETARGGLPLAHSAVDACGFMVPITAWRNRDEAKGRTTVTVSFARGIVFSQTVSESQKADVKQAVLRSFLKYAESTGLNVMEAEDSAAQLSVDPTTGQLRLG